MKKNLMIFSLLAMSLLMVSSVVAVSFQDPKLTEPETNDYVSGVIDVEWDNPENDPNIYIQYQEGHCSYTLAMTSGWTDLGPFPSTQTSTTIDTTELDGGDLCIRLRANGETHLPFASVIVDNEGPFASIEKIPNKQGIESDIATDDTRTYVSVIATDNDAINYCKINWGDGTAEKDCTSNPIKIYKHQYGDSGQYDITLTVKDKVGNEDSDSTTVTVENIDPEITDQIKAPNNEDADGNELVEAVVGEAVLFTASTDDVDADLDAGLTCEWTFDGSDEVETTADTNGDCEVYYTWDSASEHTVELTVEDKDGGSVDAVQFELEVEEPEQMTPMQKVIVGKNFKFNLDEPWNVGSGNNVKFQTEISGLTNCDLVTSIGGMTVNIDGAGKCKVIWTPTNSERGEHTVIVKARNGVVDYKYYSFDVTVYSWGIELNPGWNLISIPLMPEDTDIKDVFADIIENVHYDTSEYSVFQYDATSGSDGKWYKAKPSKSKTSFSGTLKDIVPGYGYWIKMENADVLYGAEDFFPINTVPREAAIDLATESWNLIGRFGVEPVPLEWKIALESLRKPFYNKNYVSKTLGIYKLLSVVNEITTWGSADTIDLGKGYWVRTAEGDNGRTTVRYEPDSI